MPAFPQRSFVPPLSSQERRRSTVGVPSNALGRGYMVQGYGVPPVQNPGMGSQPSGAEAAVYRPWMQNHPAYQGQVVSGPSRPSFVPPMGNAVQLAGGGRFTPPMTQQQPVFPHLPQSFDDPWWNSGVDTSRGLPASQPYTPHELNNFTQDIDSQHAANMAFAQQAMQQAQQQRQQIASQWDARSQQLQAGGGGYAQQPLMPGRGGSMIPPRPQQQPMMAGNPTDAAWAMGQQRRFTPPMAQPGGYGPPSPGSQMQMAGGPGSMVPIDPNSEVLRPRTGPFMNAGYHGGGSDQSGPSQVPTTQRGGSTYVDLNNVPEGERFGVGTAPGMGWVDRQRQRDGLPGLVVQSHGDGTGELVRRPGYHPPGSPENPYTADQLAKQQAGRDARADKKDRMLANRQNYYGVKPKDSLVPGSSGGSRTQLVDGKDKQGRQVAPATPVSQSFHIPTEGPISGVPDEHSNTFRAFSNAMDQAKGNKKKFWDHIQGQGIDKPAALQFAKWLEANPQPLTGIRGALSPKEKRDAINTTAAQMRDALENYFDPAEMDVIRPKRPNYDNSTIGGGTPVYELPTGSYWGM